MMLWLDLKFLLGFWARVWNFSNLELFIKGCTNVSQVCIDFVSEQVPFRLIVVWFMKSLVAQFEARKRLR